MLRRISVKNLGCFDDKWYTVEFSEETLIAGPNNSGKSMLIAGMNLLRYFVVDKQLSWNTQYYKLNSFDDAVNGHDPNKIISISIMLTEDSAKHVVEIRIRRDKPAVLMFNGVRVSGLMWSRIGRLVKNIWHFSPNRSIIPYQSNVAVTSGPLQQLRPDGSNVINFLLERWTDRDPNWSLVESWLKKIDPDMSEMKTPIRGSNVSFETSQSGTSVNVSLQGSGFQNAAAIISAVLFSPKNSTLIIEEPEAFLHPESQEILVDMLNDAVNNQGKQIIFSTHSCNILLPFWSDVGKDASQRSKKHIIADPKKFSMWTFEKALGKVSISRYPLQSKTFRQFRSDFKGIWG